MKQLTGLLMFLILLGGCAKNAQPVWETICDNETAAAISKEPRCRLCTVLPEDASAEEALSTKDCQVYRGEYYEITTEALSAESLEYLLKELTGRSSSELTILHSQYRGLPRYDLTWITGGDEGLMLRRSAILDDGQNYYVLTVSYPYDAPTSIPEAAEACFAQLRLLPAAESII